MGIFSSTSAAICSVLDTAADIGDAAGKTVSMATTYVDNRATAQKLTDKQAVMLTTAKQLRTVQAELDADADLAAMFKSLATEFK